jgi:hypothetical protein
MVSSAAFLLALHIKQLEMCPVLVFFAALSAGPDTR